MKISKTSSYIFSTLIVVFSLQAQAARFASTEDIVPTVSAEQLDTKVSESKESSTGMPREQKRVKREHKKQQGKSVTPSSRKE